jgi:hypothetical protein
MPSLKPADEHLEQTVTDAPQGTRVRVALGAQRLVTGFGPWVDPDGINAH